MWHMLQFYVADVHETRAAIAPYNFVPLPEHIVRAEQVVAAERVPSVRKANGELQEFPYSVHHDTYHTERHTGTITCTLTTASPLYLRCGLTPDQLAQGLAAKDLPDFF